MSSSTAPDATAPTSPHLSPATFRGDLGGSLGDLGTLLPFMVGYIVVAGVQASAILLAFGLCLLAVGWRYGIPFPVQPMKAVGAAALASAATASHNMPEVERMCSHVMMMRDGSIVDRGAPAELIAKYGRQDLEEVFLHIARHGAEAGGEA